MKKITLVVSLLLSLAAVLGTEDQPPGFAGTWILVPEKSDPYPHPADRPASITDNSSYIVGADNPVPFTFPLYGETYNEYSERRTREDIKSSANKSKRLPRSKNQPDAIVGFVLEQAGNDAWKVSSVRRIEGKDIMFIETFKCDGTEHVKMALVPNSADKIKQSTKATLKNNKLQIVQVFHNPQETIKIKNAFLLSKDGQTLTLKTEDSSNLKMLEFQTLIYRRQ